MDSKTRIGRNPFEASAKRPMPIVAGGAGKKRVLTAANRKAEATRRSRTNTAAPSAILPQAVFHYAFEVPAHGAFLAIKACLLTFAVARELGNEARAILG